MFFITMRLNNRGRGIRKNNKARVYPYVLLDYKINSRQKGEKLLTSCTRHYKLLYLYGHIMK